MNKDAVKSNVTHALGIVAAWAAGRYHLSADQLGAVMSDIGYVAAVLAWLSGFADHWGMKKVPVAGAMIAAIAVTLAFSGAPVHAGDLPAKAPRPTRPALAPPPPCTATSCRVWTAFAELDGHATNMNVLGNGFNGSLLAGGATPLVGISGFTWNGSYAYGVAAACGYSFNVSGPSVQGYECWQELQFGGNLAALFSQAAATPPSGIAAALMFPYAAVGPDERQHGGTGWRAGAGLKFFLDAATFLDVGYRAVNQGNVTVAAGTVQKTDNITYVALHKAIPSLLGW